MPDNFASNKKLIRQPAVMQMRDLTSRVKVDRLSPGEAPSLWASFVGSRWRMQRRAASSSVLWRRGAEFLGSRYAIMGGAMTWVSDSCLVAAMSNAGAFGVLAGGALSGDELDREVASTFDLTDQSFGVNVITFSPHFDAQLDVCLARRVSHIIIGGGVPTVQQITRAKQAGAKVIAFAASMAMGVRALRNGAEALIAEGREAGGHVGPLSSLVLAQDLLPILRRAPVFFAGGVGCGEMVAHFLRLGAAGCQLGTRFVCARESRVHPLTKKAYLKASGRDAVLSVQVDPEFRVAPVRALVNKASQAFVAFQLDIIRRYRMRELSKVEAQLEIESFWSGRLRRAVQEGDVEFGSLMAGQSVEFLRGEESVCEIIEDLVARAQVAATA